MANLYPISGSKLFIGGRVTDKKDALTAADFAAQSWTEIDGWANAGQLGDTQEIITQALINRGRVMKIKGTRDAGDFENQFVPMRGDPGQEILRGAIEDCYPYAFKVEWGADCVPESDVTISVATPAVVTWPGHGLSAGQPVVFSTTGALPTGLTAGTVYYVLPVGLTASEFSVSATVGGTAVATTAAGTGVQSVTAAPEGQTSMFYALATSETLGGGDANTVQMMTTTLAVTSNLVTV